MMNLLTAAEAAQFLRCETDDTVMLMLLPLVDSFVQHATGRDWAADATKHPLAKAAAGILLVKWYDNPAQAGNESEMPFGLTNVLAQLEAEALKYRKYVFYGTGGAGGISVPGAQVGDQVMSLVGLYGVSGDQRAKFASVVDDPGIFEQTAAENLAENLYMVILKAPADDVSA
jgi:hypothetical protein